MNKTDFVFKLLKHSGLQRVKKTATGVVCLCPYHKEKSPSFNMHRDGYFHCWGCKESGSLAQFLVDIGKYKSKQTAEVFLRTQNFVIEDEELEKELEELNKEITETNEQTLRESILGIYDYCPTYMLRRGFTKETLKYFEVGYDKSEYSVTIPVRDVDGKLIGISRRVIDDDTVPRYDHSGIKTSKHLYHMDKCVRYKPSKLILVEGQTDVWRIWQEAQFFAVSSFGSKLSKTQAELISDLNPEKVFIMFDGDNAGQKAIEVASDFLLELMELDQIMVANKYPDGKGEPDELTRKEIIMMLKSARFPLDYKMG